MGNNAGCLGETCALAILIGGAYLIARRVISPVIPVTYLATAALFSALFGRDPLFDLLSGGLLLGAFFMATDYTTSPLYFWGRVVFAFGCGLITMVIREFGSLPEGVSYSIILMNILTPLLERAIKPRAFGSQRPPRGRREAPGMKLSWKEILRPTAVLFVICVAVAAAWRAPTCSPRSALPSRPWPPAEESRKVVLPGAEEFQAQEDGAYYTGRRRRPAGGLCL